MRIWQYQPLFECQTDPKNTSYRGLSAVSKSFLNIALDPADKPRDDVLHKKIDPAQLTSCL